MAFLDVRDLSIYYETAHVLRNISLSLEQGEAVGVVGPNGAGKSTLLRTICGLVRWEKGTLKGTKAGDITIAGTVEFNGERIDRLPAHEIVKRGLIHCPERRRPFREMTTLENLKAAGYLLNRTEFRRNLDEVYALFPTLEQRKSQLSGTLSGGEQQMLAIGRSLILHPRLLVIDEPTLGLAPLYVESIMKALKKIHHSGVSILLVEQDVTFAFELSSRSYVISAGNIVKEGRPEELQQDDALVKTYLGM